MDKLSTVLDQHSARNILVAIANDFQNNYLTYQGYADLNGITKEQAETLITLAQAVRRSPHPDA